MNHPRKFPIPWFLQGRVTLRFPPHCLVLCPSFSANRGRRPLSTCSQLLLTQKHWWVASLPWASGPGEMAVDLSKEKHQPSINRHLPHNSLLRVSCSAQYPRQAVLIGQKGCSWTGALSRPPLFPGSSSASSVSPWIFPLLLTLA